MRLIEAALRELDKEQISGKYEIFHNDNGHDYEIIDKCGNNALLHDTKDGVLSPWICAWELGKKSWGQGHYFQDEMSAKEYWKDNYKKKCESIKEGFKDYIDKEKDGFIVRFSDRDGYHIESKNSGKVYAIVEMMSYGGRSTTDAIAIIETDPDEGFTDNMIIDYGFGAEFGEDDDGLLNYVIDKIKEYESRQYKHIAKSGRKDESLNEGGYINYDDDIVIVKKDGEVEYKGIWDDWKFDEFYDEFTYNKKDGKYHNLDKSKGDWTVEVLDESLTEAEMSPEDQADSDVLNDVIRRTRGRVNAKITPEQQKVLDKYGVYRKSGYTSYVGPWANIVDKYGNKLEPQKDKVNFADKIRKSNGPRGDRRRELIHPDMDVVKKSRYGNEYSERTPGADAERIHGGKDELEYDWGNRDENGNTKMKPTGRMLPKDIELEKERQRQATNMYKPMRDMKVALSDRNKHQRDLDAIEKNYASDVAYANDTFNRHMRDAEERRTQNRQSGEQGLADANDRINKLLKR